ncbi:MAG: 6-phosphofructokinase 1 [Myxococcota bacterium]|jgi:6-phosphofructokinase 1
MRLAVLTSGGDAPGMNAALRVVAKLGAARGVHVDGVMHGYDGLMAGRFLPLTREIDGGVVPTSEVDRLGSEGGTLLGSVRSAAFRTPEGRSRAAGQLDDHLGLIVIGGNGSLTGAHLLATEHDVPVVGLPASIDNDIGCTSTAIGVDTALNTILDAGDRIADTARAHRRAFVIEVMGRDCGYLAMASAVALGADAVLSREQGHSEAELVHAVAQVVRHGLHPSRAKRRVLVIKAEGVAVPTDRLVTAVQAAVREALPDVEVRGTVLGHVIRGGRPSYQDRMVASRLARDAVNAVLDGVTDTMCGWRPDSPGGTPTDDPSVRRFPLERVLDETRALLDGTSPVARTRMRLLHEVEGVLAL